MHGRISMPAMRVGRRRSISMGDLIAGSPPRRAEALEPVDPLT